MNSILKHSKSPRVPLRCGFVLQGRIRLEVYDKLSGKKTKDTGWFGNLVVDQGLDALATQADVFTWFHVGTSSDAASPLDTWLHNWLASSNNQQNEASGATTVAPLYVWKRRTMRFAVGAAEGNLSEVGVGWSSSSGTLFARQLIQDAAGDPTTITVLSNEFLDFTYELRYIVPTTDWDGVLSIDGISYNVKMRAANCTSGVHWVQWVGKQFIINVSNESYHRCYEGAIGAVTALPSGEVVSTGTVDGTSASYSVGNYYRDFTVIGQPGNWNPPSGLIKCLVLSCRGTRWQAQFTKVSDGTGMPKSVANIITVVYRVHWARAA